MISLKHSSVAGQERVSFRDCTLFLEYLDSISKKTGIPIERCQLSVGYPLEILFGEPGDILSSIKLLTSGSVVLIRAGSPASLRNLDDDMNKKTLHLLSMGFPLSICQKSMEICGNDMGLSVEICEGLMAESASIIGENQIRVVSTDKNDKRVLIRRVIDADNSCLFNALGYLMERDYHKMNLKYREMVADEIRSNINTYSAEILGKDPEDYIKWILDPISWGGEIEMNILSNQLKVQIAAVDIQTGKVYIYGEHPSVYSRIYVLYDGIHYDSLVSADTQQNEDNDITIFLAADKSVANQAEEVASELRKKKQFINLVGCDLQCLVCLKGLSGQKGAQEHAKVTGHQNFGQINK
jgi:ubiquitin thioesterase OTU1